jgi:sugar phosphate permease
MVKTVKSKNLNFAWFVWGLAATFFFCDYMARVAPSVMHKFLQADFALSEVGFATLNASFYIPYILMQLPVGLTVDRLSIRVLLSVMSFITAIGCVIFGFAHSLWLAAFARILIGFSAAFAFISALRLANAWFPRSMHGLIAGLTQSLGMLGAFTGGTALAFLLSYVSWRESMYMMAVIFVIIALLIYLYVHDSPEALLSKLDLRNKQWHILQDLRTVMSNRQTWINAVYAGLLYAPSAVIGEALGPAYLQYGHGLSAHAAAFASGFIFIGWVIGGPISGWLSDYFKTRKIFMIVSAVCGVLFMSILVFAKSLNAVSASILLFCYGLTNTGVAISYALATEIQDKKVTGTAIAFTNMASIFFGACLQPLVGLIIDITAAGRAYNVSLLTLHDFKTAFYLLPLSSTLALIFALFIRPSAKPNEPRTTDPRA